jgi:hypothetical protein
VEPKPFDPIELLVEPEPVDGEELFDEAPLPPPVEPGERSPNRLALPRIAPRLERPAGAAFGFEAVFEVWGATVDAEDPELLAEVDDELALEPEAFDELELPPPPGPPPLPCLP